MADPAYIQPTAYDESGNAVDPESAPQAVAEGRAFYKKGERVYVRNETGQLGTVDAEDAAAQPVLSQQQLKEHLLKRDAESVSGLVKTGAEGLARGATLGFAGPEQFYDAEGRANARARQQYNPNLSAGSELAGTVGAAVATSVLSGGAATGGTAARLAALAGRGALTPFRAAAALGEAAEGGAALLGAGRGIVGTAARLGARGLAEGAVMGVGHEVSQAALEDVPLTAERLLAGAWDGAKVGGAFGAGLGVLGAGVGKAGKAIIGRMAESGDDLGKATGSFAERTMGRQVLDNNAKIWRQATNDGADMARPARIGRKMLDADLPTATPAALKRATELADEAVTRMKAIAQAADETGAAVQPQRILSSVDDQIAKLKETPFGDFQSIAKRIENEIAPFRAKADAAAARGAGEPARIRLPDGTIEIRPRTPEAPMKFSELWDLRQKLDKVVYREGAARGPAKEALEEMRDSFRRELDTTIEAAAATSGAPPELLGAWKKATEDYSDFALVKKSLKELTKKQGKNRTFSLTDYGSGGAAGLLMGVLSGSPLTGMATTAIAGAAHKLIRERGAGVLAKLADRTGNVAGKMEMAGKVAAMIESPKRVAIPAAVNISQAFERYSGVLTQANADPAKFAERVGNATADLSLRFPEVAQQIQKTMMDDMLYLNQLHPQPASRRATTLTPNAIKPAFYAFNQQKAFVDAAIALDNPMSVFEDISHGELPLTGISALRARRPALFAEMRQTVVKYTVQREEELPFSRRMLLGVAFDFPADWSMLNVGFIQQSLVAPEKKPNDPTAAPSKVNKDPGGEIAPGSF